MINNQDLSDLSHRANRHKDEDENYQLLGSNPSEDLSETTVNYLSQGDMTT